MPEIVEVVPRRYKGLATSPKAVREPVRIFGKFHVAVPSNPWAVRVEAIYSHRGIYLELLSYKVIV